MLQAVAIPPLPDRLIRMLQERFGDDFSRSHAVRQHHGEPECFYPTMPPQAVVFPRSTHDVAAIVKAASAEGVPIIPFGTGTSLEGHVLATRGGITIDLSRMNRVVEVNVEDLDCLFEAGVTRTQLNQDLRATGLFFPIDPGADASLGGMAATRASGTNAVRYGTMRSNVLGLTVVTPAGDIIHTGGRARKSSAGYDLTALMVGSEGTLGVITEVRLKLYGQPEAIAAGVCPFQTLKGAVSTVVQTIQLGIGVARIELLDDLQMKAINRYSGSVHPELPTLFLEFHGSELGVEEQSSLFGRIAAENGGGDFRSATKTEERSALWDARHKAYFAAQALAPGKQSLVTDVCVPISCLAECIEEARHLIERSGLIGTILGHVGDGNFHVVLLFDPGEPGELDIAKAIVAGIVDLALERHGTCTGEHGIGLGKKSHLLREQGPAVEIMRLIKRALDPQGVMNPDKVFDL